MKRFRALRALLLLGSAAALAGAEPASALTLTRHPSLWDVTPSAILIAWQTDVSSTGKVAYGKTPALGSEITDAAISVDHAVTITGLDPGVRYYYQILSDAIPLTAGDDTFHTAPPAGAPFRFAAFADCGSGDANQAAVAARIAALNPDLAIIMGDVIYESGEAVNFTPRYFTPYRSIIRRSVFYPVVGNHDIVTSNGRPFLDAFYLPGNSVDETEKYYSFDYGNAHFVAIDGNQYLNFDMYAWADADLAATIKPWKFAYVHQPLYSNPGGHGSDLNLRSNLEPIFRSRGVDVVFQGHNHFFSRSYPIANGVAVDTAQGSSYHDPAGTIYLVSGGGGKALYAVAENDPLTRSAFSLFHTLVVDVAGDSVYIQAVRTDGAVFDSLSIKKSAAAAVQRAPRLEIQSARPNPFGRETALSFTLPRAMAARLMITDVSGRRVRELWRGDLPAGSHTMRWNTLDDRGRRAASGIYFAALRAEGRLIRTRLVLLR